MWAASSCGDLLKQTHLQRVIERLRRALHHLISILYFPKKSDIRRSDTWPLK